MKAERVVYLTLSMSIVFRRKNSSGWDLQIGKQTALLP